MGIMDEEPLPINATAVAIDKDKYSQYAVKWAIDHLVSNTHFIILIHVRQKNLLTQAQGEGGNDADPQQLFVPYRVFCARKTIQVKEVILEDTDVSKALLDYVSSTFITNVVLGASSRNAFTKTFKKPDVPSTVTKSAPEFCSVYVVAKGKVASVRSAQRPIANTAIPPKLPTSHDELGARTPSSRGSLQPMGFEKHQMEKNSDSIRVAGRQRLQSNGGARRSPPNLSLDNIDVSGLTPISSAQSSFSNEDVSGALGFRSLDVTMQHLDFSTVHDSMGDELNAPSSSKDREAEMRRLRLELKQTMDMYSAACKEAIKAKQKAKELGEMKMEEVRMIEQAKLAGEAALAIAEVEKAKCKAAIEAAEASQKLADRESQKRRLAEMKAKRESEEKDRALTALAHNDIRYRKYTIDEIETATEKFSSNLKIGEGGYGPVYRGTLDHTPVAIKVLRPDAAQGRKQFQQEVEVLSCMRHPHMVLLVGACPEYGCLVYEYMNYGSLDDRLFRRGGTPPIPWRIRFKIAAEITTALAFLHHTKPEPLVHRDLKPANILLDRNFVSKISDVGLARLVPPSVANSVTQYHMTSAAGTFCYIDPEYQQTGMLTTKSDIYSLGIMLLQIITARPAMGLSHHAQRAVEHGTLHDLLDPTVTDWPMEEATAFAKISLKCCELRKKDRPDLAKVVLPELNRLKDIAMNENDSAGFQFSPFHSSSTSGSSSRPRPSPHSPGLGRTTPKTPSRGTQ